MTMRAVALRRVTAALFAVSTTFPIAASLLPTQATPLWLGIADVAVAAALMAAGFVVVARAPKTFDPPTTAAAFRVLRAGSALFLLLLVLFFLAGDAVRWQVLLPGLAWRAWLFVLVLPAWIALR
jgi:lysylphosphatidylglycerol synthetase-like protein (DUF2156 family)